MTYRVLVCGDRNWSDVEMVFKSLDALRAKLGDVMVIEGGARGADRIAGQWAVDRGVPLEVYEADWVRYGRGAGPVRNKLMLDQKPDVVVAFHDAITHSKGTANMIEQAEAAGVKVLLLGHVERLFDG